MSHSLTEYDKFKVIRPVIGNHILDSYDLPVMHRITESEIDITKATPLNIANLCAKYKNSDKVVLPFNDDKSILKYWNDPLKYIPLLQTAMAVGTPDYSVYTSMNSNEIRHNVYMNRWLGCLWQDYNINALPTLQWSTPDTYDICFGGTEKGGIVLISTIGVHNDVRLFYQGFNAMKERLNPSLIIVYGNMLPEMYGRFINYKYTDAFNSNKQAYKQLSLFDSSMIFERKRGA
ncbi:MAG: DUF4417 domain-containing protein [Lachnospiraceae bacterium]|nr:DUF4417 domain-containing protein [Lachnospiraceae bacterium]